MSRPVFSWRTAVSAQKETGIVTGMGKPTVECDPGNAVITAAQQTAADVQPAGVQKIDRALSQIPAKDRAAFAAADIACRCDIIQSQLIHVMLVYIRNHIFLYLKLGRGDVVLADTGYFLKPEKLAPEKMETSDDFHLKAERGLLIQIGNLTKAAGNVRGSGMSGGDQKILQRPVIEHRSKKRAGDHPVFGEEGGMKQNTDEDTFFA